MTLAYVICNNGKPIYASRSKRLAEQKLEQLRIIGSQGNQIHLFSVVTDWSRRNDSVFVKEGHVWAMISYADVFSLLGPERGRGEEE